MTSQDITLMSATDTASAIKSKKLSPVAAVEAYLDRIDRLDSQLAAYITVCREEALADARRAEEALSQGGNPGLEGRPHRSLGCISS